ncbi:unnamed protein product [Chondrus crispus]|uniref:Uncharacterized protein n=1 Tax=Chondrus crispus TaxID=2769 RepID=R7QP95_CHOCR|nr:unnamed protein product [Chondrus crispus]CDF39210.1 unnamed protein product [Chondrus crispus]|eukprot:XP_005719121.1 unnamed protein product [Chondrus crispus]
MHGFERRKRAQHLPAMPALWPGRSDAPVRDAREHLRLNQPLEQPRGRAPSALQLHHHTRETRERGVQVEVLRLRRRDLNPHILGKRIHIARLRHSQDDDILRRARAFQPISGHHRTVRDQRHLDHRDARNQQPLPLHVRALPHGIHLVLHAHLPVVPVQRVVALHLRVAMMKDELPPHGNRVGLHGPGHGRVGLGQPLPPPHLRHRLHTPSLHARQPHLPDAIIIIQHLLWRVCKPQALQHVQADLDRRARLARARNIRGHRQDDGAAAATQPRDDGQDADVQAGIDGGRPGDDAAEKLGGVEVAGADPAQQLVGGGRVAVAGLAQSRGALDNLEPVGARDVDAAVDVARRGRAREVGVRDVERWGGARARGVRAGGRRGGQGGEVRGGRVRDLQARETGEKGVVCYGGAAATRGGRGHFGGWRGERREGKGVGDGSE